MNTLHPHRTHLPLTATPQPTETSCGPACLHTVYTYFGDDVPLEQIIAEVEQLRHGGTIAVMLGLHAISRGYRARIYTCDLHMFDPSWFPATSDFLRAKLVAQQASRSAGWFRTATDAYLRFLDAGGEVDMRDIDIELFDELLAAGSPIIAGLSATWLYRCARELHDCTPDDVAGEPTGHFLVLHGVDTRARTLDIADPYLHRPTPGSHHYTAPVPRVISAIMLGIVTNDAKLLVIRRP